MVLFDNFFKKKIQASEGVRSAQDPLTPPVLSTTTKEVRKNNFRTYSSQIDQIYQGYNAKAEYGANLIRPAIDLRVALVCGDGISINSENKKTEFFLNELIDYNKFYGSALIKAVEIAEKEGKCLILLLKKKIEKDIKIIIKPISWWYQQYTIVEDESGEIKGAQWGNSNINRDRKEIDLKPTDFVYIITGSQTSDINQTHPRIANVLTQLENHDRALYDLRENNHLFGRTTPYWKTQDNSTAKDILKNVAASNWKVGTAMAANADFSLIGPSNQASDPILREMAINLKIISACTGIPVHWLGWTDLMSNRATADELSNFVEAATKKERLIWIEAITDILRKAMIMSIDSGIENAINDPYGFTIDMPFINKEKLKEIIEVWLPLQQEEVIDMGSLRNKIPGINPLTIKEAIESEKENNKEENPVIKKYNEFISTEEDNDNNED